MPSTLAIEAFCCRLAVADQLQPCFIPVIPFECSIGNRDNAPVGPKSTQDQREITNMGEIINLLTQTGGCIVVVRQGEIYLEQAEN